MRVEGLTGTLALRLLIHGENRFARFVTWVSFFGLTLGVMVLTVVVTVMNGFDYELKQRLLRSIPHITVPGAAADDPIAEFATGMAGVQSVHEYFQGLGAISAAGEVYPLSLYAARAAGLRALTALAESTRDSGLQRLGENPNGVLLGAPLVRLLGLVEGDPVLIMSVAADQGVVKPRMLKFELVGTFELGAEPDYNLAILNLERLGASHWRSMGETGLQLQLQEPLRARQLRTRLESAFRHREVSSWESAYGELFSAVQLEKSMMFLLLLLVVAIASFNIVAGQTMLVNDKRHSIAILRTMGARQSLVRNVFLLQGAGISVMGTALGLCLGLLAADNINQILDFIEQVTGMHLLDGSFFVQVPIRVLPGDLVVISLLSAGLCLLSSWVPARRAAQLDPVANLH